MAPKDRSMANGADGWISDESSFYGDKETQQDLEEYLDGSSTPDNFWAIQHSLPATIALANKADETSSAGYFPREGDLSARQSTESVEEFLKRLPPSKCNALNGPWLWIDNPKAKSSSTLDSETVKTSSNLDWETMGETGQRLLNDFKRLKQNLESEGKTPGVIGKKLAPRRVGLVEELKKLAVKTNCVVGKWMLFVPEPKVDQVWAKVAHAVAVGTLGPTAKVATASASYESRERLICIYTENFTDLGDVKRVLNALISLGLVNNDNGSRGIYYKCDLYTYLGIDSKNDFGLKASLYSSKDMNRTTADKRR